MLAKSTGAGRPGVWQPVHPVVCMIVLMSENRTAAGAGDNALFTTRRSCTGALGVVLSPVATGTTFVAFPAALKVACAEAVFVSETFAGGTVPSGPETSDQAKVLE